MKKTHPTYLGIIAYMARILNVAEQKFLTARPNLIARFPNRRKQLLH